MDSMLISINIIKDNLKKELSTVMENLQILNKNTTIQKNTPSPSLEESTTQNQIVFEIIYYVSFSLLY